MMMENSLKIAKFLEGHPKVERVNHPGLSSHKNHKLSLRQSSGHSGLMSFAVKGNVSSFVDELKIISNAASFGGCESLVELP